MSSEGRPENVFERTSLGPQTGTPIGRHLGMSLGLQVRTSTGWSNRIFREYSGDVGGGRWSDIHGTNIFRLGDSFGMIVM